MGLTCAVASPKCFSIFVFIDLVFASVSTVYILGLFTTDLINFFALEESVNAGNSTSSSTETHNGHFGFVGGMIGFGIALLLLYWIFEVYLFTLARRGIKNKNYKDCRKWFCTRLAFLIFGFLNMMFKLPCMDGRIILASVICILYQGYKLIVAISFMESIKPEKVPAISV